MVFFTMVFIYGLLVVLYIPRLHADIVSLLALPPGSATPFDSELWFFRLAMYAGTGNYVLFMLVWAFLWRAFAIRLRSRNLDSMRAAGEHPASSHTNTQDQSATL